MIEYEESLLDYFTIRKNCTNNIEEIKVKWNSSRRNGSILFKIEIKYLYSYSFACKYDT